MPTTTFRPQLDSFVLGQALLLDPATKERIRDVISQAIPEIIPTLRPSYGAMLDEYCAIDSLSAGLGEETPDYFGQSTLLAFAALDCFYTKTPAKRYKSFSTKHHVTAQAFFVNRLLTAIQDNISVLTVWLTVLHAIPENWFPESLIKHAIEREINRLGVYHDTVIEFELQLPIKGGGQWLKQKSLTEWSILKKHIDDGKPWPIGLIRKQRQLNFYIDETVVVYAYAERSDNTASIYLYDTQRPWFEHMIDIDFNQSELLTQETFAGIEKPPIAGFVCKRYAAIRPPLFGQTRDYTVR